MYAGGRLLGRVRNRDRAGIPVPGVPPDGKRLQWTEIHFLRLERGQIVEHWANFDQLGVLQQLGAIPAG